MPKSRIIRIISGITTTLLALPVAAQIIVSDPRIDVDTRGDWRGTYGECFALVPQANPRTLIPEVQVGPDFFGNAPGQYDNNPQPFPDGSTTSVCVTGDGVPASDPTMNFDFRFYRNSSGTQANAFVWAFREPGTGTDVNGDGLIDYEVLPGSSQWNACQGTFRAGTFDNGRFAFDPLSTVVQLKTGGDATLAFYFLTAFSACREHDYTLFIDDVAAKSGTIGDFASGKYVVFDLQNIPTSGATVRLAVRDNPAAPSCSVPRSVTGLNSHMSGIFIDGTAACGVTARLGDRVWEDIDGDGIQDCEDTNNNGVLGDAGDLPPASQPNECASGVANVLASLISNPDGDAACDSGDEFNTGATRVTDSDGFYLFDNLAPGSYCVVFQPPAGFAFTAQDSNDGQGDPDVRDSDADPTTGRTPDYDLNAGDSELTVDAGIVRLGRIGDQVWFDLNRDGIQDDVPGTEPGVPNVKVSLYQCDPVSATPGTDPIAMMMTDGNGLYLFDDLHPGLYEVEFSNLPGGYVLSPRNAGAPAVDSDADPASGRTGCIIALDSGETDLTWDAGINQPPAGLGDRLWEDLNADGVQDPGEPGIPGATVELLAPGPDGICDSGDETALASILTIADGFYEFTNLNAGRYCVRFELPDICTLFPARFSPAGAGSDDGFDSDANPSSGQTGNIDLPANTFDPNWDAGVYCPAKLGDFVWLDGDQNGLQDPGETGQSGVEVALTDCDGNDVVDADGVPVSKLFTDGGGMYMFNNLVPGRYRLMFTPPTGVSITQQDADDGQPNADARDSDASPGNGKTECIPPLESDEYDPTWDAGLFPTPPCALDVTKTCRIIPVVTESLTCSDVKPIDEITMRWTDGGRVIDRIDVYSSTFSASEPTKDRMYSIDGPIVDGDEVAADRYVEFDASNDVDWVLTFSDGSQAISRFHRSCSDDDMDGPEDCGALQGNAKNNDASTLSNLPIANLWAFEALAGDGKVLDCTVPDVPGTATECEFGSVPPPHCEGKVQALKLRYLGGECIVSNTQEGKAYCEVAGTAGAPVRIRVSDGGSKVFLDTGSANVAVGDVVTASKAIGGSDFGSSSVLEVFSATGALVQQVPFHTSCSKPLNLGDRFGTLEVVGVTTDELSATLGAEVRYDYAVTNTTGETCAGTAVDDKLGLIANLSLAPLGTTNASRTSFVMPDDSNSLTNTVVAQCTLTNGTVCRGEASATVTRVPPPPAPVTCSDIKPISAVSLVWNGASGVNVLAESGELFENVQHGNLITFSTVDLGNDVMLSLSGAVNGMSAVHVSCSDDAMDGSEDCGSAQGNNKDDDAGLINDFLFSGMQGSDGTMACSVPNTGVVVPVPGSAGTGMVVGEPTLDLGDDKKLKWKLTNYGQNDVFLTRVVVSWPSAHGQLKKAKLEGDFAKDVFDATSPTALPDEKAFESDANKRKLKAGDDKNLEIEFTTDYKEHSASQFTITVEFDNGQTLTF